MKYYVALYLSDPVYGSSPPLANFMQIGMWKKHATAFGSSTEAHTARTLFIKQNPTVIIDKMRVFTELEWKNIPSGFKHPDDRPKRKKVKNMTGANYHHREHIYTAMGQALREAGL